jgi:hypothetical protein
MVDNRVPLDARLAKVSYEATRAWTEVSGAPPKKPWEETEDWRRKAAVQSVRAAIAGDTAEHVHEAWRQQRISEGWQYGEQKSEAAKTNPSLLPYAELGDTQKRAADLFSAAVHTAYKCGTERWAVKTMTDPHAKEVTLAAVPSTVKALCAGPLPPEGVDRREPQEFTTYELKGTIVVAKLEADKDLHLVLQDPDDPKVTMIVESASPDCAKASIVASQITDVRKALEEHFPNAAAGGREEPNLAVTVTGVGFFDRLHNQEGVGPNGIELHPLLSLVPA